MYGVLHFLGVLLSVPFWVIGIILLLSGLVDSDNVKQVAVKHAMSNGQVRLIGLIFGPMLLVIAWFMCMS